MATDRDQTREPLSSYSFRIDAEFSALRELGREYTEFVERVLRSDTEIRGVQDLRLALHEAVTNIIEHGRLFPREEAIRIELDHRPAALIARVHYRGRPFDPSAAKCEPPPPEVLAEGGYGLYLIRSLASKIDHESSGDGVNTLTLTKNLGEEAA